MPLSRLIHESGVESFCKAEWTSVEAEDRDIKNIQQDSREGQRRCEERAGFEIGISTAGLPPTRPTTGVGFGLHHDG